MDARRLRKPEERALGREELRFLAGAIIHTGSLSLTGSGGHYQSVYRNSLGQFIWMNDDGGRRWIHFSQLSTDPFFAANCYTLIYSPHPIPLNNPTGFEVLPVELDFYSTGQKIASAGVNAMAPLAAGTSVAQRSAAVAAMSSAGFLAAIRDAAKGEEDAAKEAKRATNAAAAAAASAAAARAKRSRGDAPISVSPSSLLLDASIVLNRKSYNEALAGYDDDESFSFPICACKDCVGFVSAGCPFGLCPSHCRERLIVLGTTDGSCCLACADRERSHDILSARDARMPQVNHKILLDALSAAAVEAREGNCHDNCLANNLFLALTKIASCISLVLRGESDPPLAVDASLWFDDTGNSIVLFVPPILNDYRSTPASDAPVQHIASESLVLQSIWANSALQCTSSQDFFSTFVVGELPFSTTASGGVLFSSAGARLSVS